MPAGSFWRRKAGSSTQTLRACRHPTSTSPRRRGHTHQRERPWGACAEGREHRSVRVRGCCACADLVQARVPTCRCAVLAHTAAGCLRCVPATNVRFPARQLNSVPAAAAVQELAFAASCCLPLPSMTLPAPSCQLLAAVMAAPRHRRLVGHGAAATSDGAAVGWLCCRECCPAPGPTSLGVHLPSADVCLPAHPLPHPANQPPTQHARPVSPVLHPRRRPVVTQEGVCAQGLPRLAL